MPWMCRTRASTSPPSPAPMIVTGLAMVAPFWNVVPSVSLEYRSISVKGTVTGNRAARLRSGTTGMAERAELVGDGLVQLVLAGLLGGERVGPVGAAPVGRQLVPEQREHDQGEPTEGQAEYAQDQAGDGAARAAGVAATGL